MDTDEVTINREQAPVGRLRTCVSEQIEANSVETERIVEPGSKGWSSSDCVAKLGDFGRKKTVSFKGHLRRSLKEAAMQTEAPVRPSPQQYAKRRSQSNWTSISKWLFKAAGAISSPKPTSLSICFIELDRSCSSATTLRAAELAQFTVTWDALNSRETRAAAKRLLQMDTLRGLETVSSA
jgi:hypothetical protein